MFKIMINKYCHHTNIKYSDKLLAVKAQITDAGQIFSRMFHAGILRSLINGKQSECCRPTEFQVYDVVCLLPFKFVFKIGSLPKDGRHPPITRTSCQCISMKHGYTQT